MMFLGPIDATRWLMEAILQPPHLRRNDRAMQTIRHALFPNDRAAILDIWREYIVSPSVSLEYQDYDREFADIPGKYAHPEGRLLLAELDRSVVGCGGLRKVTETICEMKRLYVRPSARGSGLGRKLVERLISEAKRAGYAEMRLDVLDEFKRAQALYQGFGFYPAEPVSFNPVPGTLFLGRML